MAADDKKSEVLCCGLNIDNWIIYFKALELIQCLFLLLKTGFKEQINPPYAKKQNIVQQ